MKGLLRVAAGGWLVLSLGMGTAHADLVSEGMARMAAGDAAGAYAVLKGEERSRAGNPEYDYALGLAAIDAGHATDAVAAFERVLAVEPQHLRARAELGRAYIVLNEHEAARRELATVSGQNVPAEVRETVDRYVTALDTGLSGGGTEINSHAKLTLGYDTNVNNSTSDSRILIPAFAGLGFGTLSPSARAQSDSFGEVLGRVSVSHGLSIDQRLIADLTASYRGNAHEDDFNQAIAGLNLGFAQATPDHGTFLITAQLQSYWIDDEAYRYAVGALGQWNYRTKGQTDLGLYLLYSHLDYPDNKAQNANRYIAGATVGQALGGTLAPYLFGGVYGGLEKVTDSAFDYLSYGFIGARIGGELSLNEKLRAYANAAIEASDYREPEPLFLTERSTVRADASLGLRYTLPRGLTLGAEVAYTNADSNIVLYDYDRVVTSISISADF